jgi:hypothetical protein
MDHEIGGQVRPKSRPRFTRYCAVSALLAGVSHPLAGFFLDSRACRACVTNPRLREWRMEPAICHGPPAGNCPAIKPG